MENQALQALIDQRRTEPFVALEDNVEDFLKAVDQADDHLDQIAKRLDPQPT